MKKLTQKRKELNKNGLKLSLICGLNWLIKFLFKGQFYLFSSVFLGLLTVGIPVESRSAVTLTVGLILVGKIVYGFTKLIIRENWEQILVVLKWAIYFLFFMAGTNYLTHYSVSNATLNRLLNFWLISLALVAISTVIQPKLFRHYLFKNILNKEYLGIRKLTDELPPEINFYTDADEKDANKRMRQINQNVIKQPYQGVVELSFLNREVITGMHHTVDLFTKEKERIFEDVDTIYYPIFKVYPFGIEEDLGHTLIKFKLSRKTAFTKRESHWNELCKQYIE